MVNLKFILQCCGSKQKIWSGFGYGYRLKIMVLLQIFFGSTFGSGFESIFESGFKSGFESGLECWSETVHTNLFLPHRKKNRTTWLANENPMHSLDCLRLFGPQMFEPAASFKGGFRTLYIRRWWANYLFIRYWLKNYIYNPIFLLNNIDF